MKIVVKYSRRSRDFSWPSLPHHVRPHASPTSPASPATNPMNSSASASSPALKGTGDGGDFHPAMRPLQQMLGHFGDPVSLAKELKSANNVAIVMLSGQRSSFRPHHQGDKLPVKVSAIAAKSLRGGRLFLCPLQGPHPTSGIFALASGDLTLEDETVPTQASIRVGKNGGAVLTEDIAMDNAADGTFTLVLLPSESGFANATAIADQINEDVSAANRWETGRRRGGCHHHHRANSPAEAAKPAQFIARIQQLQVPSLPLTAKVIINSKSKTIVFTGDVELAPTIISQAGMSITVAPPDVPANPPGAQVDFVAIDPAKQGGAKLKDLLDSFNLLKVTADDRIAIIKQLHDSGALKCQLEID